MFKFILEIIIVCSLGVIVYLFARALPRVDDVDGSDESLKMKGDALSPYLEKIDGWISAVFEKFLRRAKVWVLKLDNLVSTELNKFKREPQKEVGFNDGEAKKPSEEEPVDVQL
jgi:hypothetical protein